MRPGTAMQKIVVPDHVGVRIGKEREIVTDSLAMAPTHVRRIDADRDDTNAALVEIAQSLLETPQLGVTQYSPITAVKDQKHGACVREQLGQRDRFTVLVR